MAVGRPAVAFAVVGCAEHEADEALAGYRASIDNIDAALVLLLAERFKITRKVGAHKAGAGLPPQDLDRERRQVARMRELAAAAGLDEAFSEKFLRFVIREVIRRHGQVRPGAESSAGGVPGADVHPGGVPGAADRLARPRPSGR